MHTAKRGWELFQSWVTRFGWEFCSTLMYTAKRGWELYESWVTRFGGEFCSTLMHTAKRGWELYESWVTRFGWEFCLTLMYAVKQGWELDESWVTRVGWESCSIGLEHDDVLLINFTTTPHSHALFARFFHLPCWYSFQFLSFGKCLHFECEVWWWNWSAKRHHA